MKRKLMVIGLDCAPPEIVLDRRRELPVLNRLIAAGRHGKMHSSHPPITIPAWMVMATGKDPGRLGLYGFRHRRAYTYDKMWIANSLSIKEPAVWDILGDAGGRSVLVSVPPSYPPHPVAGDLVGCFITPGADKAYTYPEGLKAEIESRFDGGSAPAPPDSGQLLALVDSLHTGTLNDAQRETVQALRVGILAMAEGGNGNGSARPKAT